MKKKQKCDRHFYVALGCGKYYAVIEENDCHKIYIISPCICEKCKDFEFGSLNPSIFPYTQEGYENYKNAIQVLKDCKYKPFEEFEKECPEYYERIVEKLRIENEKHKVSELYDY